MCRKGGRGGRVSRLDFPLPPSHAHTSLASLCHHYQMPIASTEWRRKGEGADSLTRASERGHLVIWCMLQFCHAPPARARTDLGLRFRGREGGRMALASLSYDSIWQRSARRVRPPLVGRGWHHISHAESSLMKSSLMQKCGGRRRGNGDADEEGGREGRRMDGQSAAI